MQAALAEMQQQLRAEFSGEMQRAAETIRRLESENAQIRADVQGSLGAIPRAIEQMGADRTEEDVNNLSQV